MFVIKLLAIIFLLYSLADNVDCLFNVYPRIKQVPIEGDPGKPLFLTPLIEAGKIKEARKEAAVPPLTGAEDVMSYAGYLTVNKKFNSNLFFWFFPSKLNYNSAPVVLWLQGGPGASSLFGLFTENGPFYVSKKLKLKHRKYSWANTQSMIFIDNPVGTGYSFTESDTGYARNETDVGRDLYSALSQFFTLFPELQKNAFFVTGESYAGKYVPAISYAIHKANPTAKLKINLQGLAIGNGLCDPEHMLKYGDYLYQIGLIDLNARNIFHEKESLGVQYIKEKKWDDAFQVFDMLLNGDMSEHGSLFYNLTGFSFYFNYLRYKDEGGDAMGKYLQQAATRKAIHVGNSTFHSDNKVEVHLKEDVMKSVKPWVEELLDSNYRVLIYNGQLDIIVAYPLTMGFVQSLNWTDAEKYKTAKRSQWYVGHELAGYTKTAGKLTEALVRDAGHMVPSDRPKWAFDLINRFTFNKPFQ